MWRSDLPVRHARWSASRSRLVGSPAWPPLTVRLVVPSPGAVAGAAHPAVVGARTRAAAAAVPGAPAAPNVRPRAGEPAATRVGASRRAVPPGRAGPGGGGTSDRALPVATGPGRAAAPERGVDARAAVAGADVPERRAGVRADRGGRPVAAPARASTNAAVTSPVRSSGGASVGAAPAGSRRTGSTPATPPGPRPATIAPIRAIAP